MAGALPLAMVITPAGGLKAGPVSMSDTAVALVGQAVVAGGGAEVVGWGVTVLVVAEAGGAGGLV